MCVCVCIVRREGGAECLPPHPCISRLNPNPIPSFPSGDQYPGLVITPLGTPFFGLSDLKNSGSFRQRRCFVHGHSRRDI